MVATPADDSTGRNHPDGLQLHESPEFIAWLTASCERNNVPVTVTDPAVIARIATLLGAGRPARSTPRTRRRGYPRPISTPKTPEAPEAITA